MIAAANVHQTAIDRILHSPELKAGLRFGGDALAIGAAAVLFLMLVSRRRSPKPGAPVVGLLLATAAVLALRDGAHLPHRLPLALAILAAAGFVGQVAHGSEAGRLITSTALATPGALLLAWNTGVEAVGWVRILVVVTVVVGGSLVADLDRRHAGAGPVLIAGSFTGVFLAVPDTEQALAILGVALPLALLGWPFPAARIGRSGSYAVSGLLAWTAAVGGTGRHSAIVGGVACLGLFVFEPLAHMMGSGPADRVRAGLPSTTLLAFGHAIAVLLMARLGGLQPTVVQATFVVAVIFVVGLGLIASLSRVRAGMRRPQPARS